MVIVQYLPEQHLAQIHGYLRDQLLVQTEVCFFDFDFDFVDNKVKNYNKKQLFQIITI